MSAVGICFYVALFLAVEHADTEKAQHNNFVVFCRDQEKEGFGMRVDIGWMRKS